jgi:pimeloyl-ACP methyl ester carboxylesterase
MTSMIKPEATPETITLADGRTLCFARYGAREGRPVLYLHGAGSSRLEGATYDQFAREAGVQIFATDRPGCGGSSPHPGWTFSSYAQDLRELADALGIGRFVVAGMSNGGAYAMAAAASLPERITAAIPINSSTPMHDAEARRVSGFVVRMSYRLLRYFPGLAVSGARRYGNSGDPQELLRRSSRESLRQPGSGYLLQEIRLCSSHWGYDHTTIRQPVEIFSGDRDAGYRYARIWAQRLPAGRLHVIPGGHGDFVAPGSSRQIVAAMAAAP